MGRPVQGPLRRGLRGDARGDAGPAEDDGPGAAGHRAAAAQSRSAPSRNSQGSRGPAVPAARLHQAVGRRFPPTRSACSARMAEVYAGFLAHADHQIGRLLDHLEATGSARQHARDPRLRQRGVGRGRPGRLGEREPAVQRDPGQPRDESGEDRRAGRTQRPTTTTPTAGRWPSTRRSRCGSATSSTVAPPTRASSAGPATRRPPAKIREQYHHAVDIVPTVLDLLGVEPPARIKGHVQSQFDGVSMRSSLADASASRRPGRPSSTRCLARAASGMTAGRRSPRTRRSAAGATSTTTPGSCITRTWTGPSCTISPPSSRRSCASSSTSGTRRRAATMGSRSTIGRRSKSS